MSGGTAENENGLGEGTKISRETFFNERAAKPVVRRFMPPRERDDYARILAQRYGVSPEKVTYRLFPTGTPPPTLDEATKQIMIKIQNDDLEHVPTTMLLRYEIKVLNRNNEVKSRYIDIIIAIPTKDIALAQRAVDQAKANFASLGVAHPTFDQIETEKHRIMREWMTGQTQARIAAPAPF